MGYSLPRTLFSPPYKNVLFYTSMYENWYIFEPIIYFYFNIQKIFYLIIQILNDSVITSILLLLIIIIIFCYNNIIINRLLCYRHRPSMVLGKLLTMFTVKDKNSPIIVVAIQR